MTPGTAAVCRAWTASLLLGKVTVGLARRFARRHDHRHVRRLDLGLVDHLVVEAEVVKAARPPPPQVSAIEEPEERIVE